MFRKKLKSLNRKKKPRKFNNKRYGCSRKKKNNKITNRLKGGADHPVPLPRNFVTVNPTEFDQKNSAISTRNTITGEGAQSSGSPGPVVYRNTKPRAAPRAAPRATPRPRVRVDPSGNTMITGSVPVTNKSDKTNETNTHATIYKYTITNNPNDKPNGKLITGFVDGIDIFTGHPYSNGVKIVREVKELHKTYFISSEFKGKYEFFNLRDPAEEEDDTQYGFGAPPPPRSVGALLGIGNGDALSRETRKKIRATRLVNSRVPVAHSDNISVERPILTITPGINPGASIPAYYTTWSSELWLIDGTKTGTQLGDKNHTRLSEKIDFIELFKYADFPGFVVVRRRNRSCTMYIRFKDHRVESFDITSVTSKRPDKQGINGPEMNNLTSEMFTETNLLEDDINKLFPCRYYIEMLTSWPKKITTKNHFYTERGKPNVYIYDCPIIVYYDEVTDLTISSEGSSTDISITPEEVVFGGGSTNKIRIKIASNFKRLSKAGLDKVLNLETVTLKPSLPNHSRRERTAVELLYEPPELVTNGHGLHHLFKGVSRDSAREILGGLSPDIFKKRPFILRNSGSTHSIKSISYVDEGQRVSNFWVILNLNFETKSDVVSLQPCYITDYNLPIREQKCEQFSTIKELIEEFIRRGILGDIQLVPKPGEAVFPGIEELKKKSEAERKEYLEAKQSLYYDKQVVALRKNNNNENITLEIPHTDRGTVFNAVYGVTGLPPQRFGGDNPVYGVSGTPPPPKRDAIVVAPHRDATVVAPQRVAPGAESDYGEVRVFQNRDQGTRTTTHVVDEPVYVDAEEMNEEMNNMIEGLTATEEQQKKDTAFQKFMKKQLKSVGKGKSMLQNIYSVGKYKDIKAFIKQIGDIIQEEQLTIALVTYLPK